LTEQTGRISDRSDIEQWALVREAPPRCSLPIVRRAKVIFGKDASHAAYGMGRSLMIIQDVPNLSRSMAKRKAKKVSAIGMKISPPSLSRA